MKKHELIEKVMRLGGPGSGNRGHTGGVGGPGNPGGSSAKGGATAGIASKTMEGLKKLATNPHRESMVDSFENEFSSALAAAGISEEDVQGIWVYGSFNSEKKYPNDIDLIALTKRDVTYAHGESFGMGPLGAGQYDIESWAQIIDHVVPMTFVNDPQLLKDLLTQVEFEAPEGYNSPVRIA